MNSNADNNEYEGHLYTAGVSDSPLSHEQWLIEALEANEQKEKLKRQRTFNPYDRQVQKNTATPAPQPPSSLLPSSRSCNFLEFPSSTQPLHQVRPSPQYHQQHSFLPSTFSAPAQGPKLSTCQCSPSTNIPKNMLLGILEAEEKHQEMEAPLSKWPSTCYELKHQHGYVPQRLREDCVLAPVSSLSIPPAPDLSQYRGSYFCENANQKAEKVQRGNENQEYEKHFQSAASYGRPLTQRQGLNETLEKHASWYCPNAKNQVKECTVTLPPPSQFLPPFPLSPILPPPSPSPSPPPPPPESWVFREFPLPIPQSSQVQLPEQRQQHSFSPFPFSASTEGPELPILTPSHQQHQKMELSKLQGTEKYEEVGESSSRCAGCQLKLLCGCAFRKQIEDLLSPPVPLSTPAECQEHFQSAATNDSPLTQEQWASWYCENVKNQMKKFMVATDEPPPPLLPQPIVEQQQPPQHWEQFFSSPTTHPAPIPQTLMSSACSSYPHQNQNLSRFCDGDLNSGATIFQKHQTDKHNTVEPNYLKCEFCPRVFSTFKSMKNHYYNYHKEQAWRVSKVPKDELYSMMAKRKFKCKYCIYAFPYRSHLENHCKDVHSDRM